MHMLWLKQALAQGLKNQTTPAHPRPRTLARPGLLAVNGYVADLAEELADGDLERPRVEVLQRIRVDAIEVGLRRQNI
eukprot:707719-Alexandrium_andersonii.AAC.1